MPKVTVAGMINDPMFHKSVSIARSLETNHHLQIECLQFFQTQWIQFLKKNANNLKGDFYEHNQASTLIYLDDKTYIGDSDQFTQWALYNYTHLDKNGLIHYNKQAKDAYEEAINNSKTRKYASMTISSHGQTETVVFELFNDIAPRTSENFLSLCQGYKRKSDGEELSYVGSDIHRIVPGMFIQGGKLKVSDKGSIYEGEFADESFHVKHTEVGLLGMCKRSGLKHTNESQFYITTGAPLSFLDNQTVVFGRVISGMQFIE